jgi:hypothetical protein
MIYLRPEPTDDIRQGDIFVAVPRIEISLDSILVLKEDGEDEETSWELALNNTTEPVTIAVAARPTMAIVITQDCDTVRADQIALCEIRSLDDVVPSLGSTVSKFVNNVKKQTKQNLKWFYLPADPTVGFSGKMAVDFQVTLTVPREQLESRRAKRIARLNPEADEHFRERLAEFFRRYPVDEWYPFTKDEFDDYRKQAPEANPRSWQQ